MDTETLLYLGLVIFGLVAVFAVMIFVMNPPEAWVKRYFQGRQKRDAGTESKQ